MPQDRGLGSVGLAMARQAVRKLRLADEAARTAASDARHREAVAFRLGLKAEREAIRASILPGARRLEDTRQEKELFIREKQHEASEEAETLRARWRSLDTVLPQALAAPVTVFLDDLRLRGTPPSLPPPPELLQPTERLVEEELPEREERGGMLAALVHLGRHRLIEPEAEPARMSRQAAQAEWNERERRRLENLTAWEVAQESDREAFLTKQFWRNRQIEAIGQAIADGDPDAIATYVGLTLERSVYPDGFPRRFDIAFDRATGGLVVDMELPGLGAVPSETDVQYIQSTNRIMPVPLRQIDRKFIYQNIVGAVALRSLHEIAGAIKGLPVTSIGLNGFVMPGPEAVAALPVCLVSILTTPAAVAALDLDDIDPRAALRALGAAVSRRTDEDPAVRPLVASPHGGAPLIRPPLDAAEFEALLIRLLQGLGLESVRRKLPDTELLLAAFDDHPVLGGKVLCAGLSGPGVAGAAAVAAFLERLDAGGAVRGLLVAPGGFDLEALQHAETKPVELIDGVGLDLIARRVVAPDD